MMPIPFPKPPPTSNLQRDLDRSIHAESIARELAHAVHRCSWHTLESWQQEDLRGASEALIRGFDLTAQAVARHHALEAFFKTLGHRSDTLGTRGEVREAFITALRSYQLHLSVSPCEERPTAAQDAAFARGISGGTE